MSPDPFFNLPKIHKKYLGRYIEMLTEVVQSGNYILGDHVNSFETQFCNHNGGTGYACGVGNATDGLIMSIKALGAGQPKRKIITTPISYLASTSSILLAGYKPVFVDVDRSGNLDSQKLKNCDLDDVAGCVFVHYSGNPTNIKEVSDFCRKNKLFLIEDCAQAMGSKLNGLSVGNFGDVSAFSFHPLKIMSALGDAGLVFTRSEELHKYLARARNHGHITRDDVAFFSQNSRLDELQAAFLSIQLKDLTYEIEKRQEQVAQYKAELKNRGVEFLFEEQGASISYNFFVVMTEKRKLILDNALSQGLELKVHYPKMLNDLKPIKGQQHQGALDVASEISQKIVSLPVGSTVSEEKIAKIISLF